MDLAGKNAVVTGAGNGIGRAIAERLRAEGVRGLVLADRDADAVQDAADAYKALAVPVDVTRDGGIEGLIETAERGVGAIDLFCGNAGILNLGDEDAPEDQWTANWNIHVMAHVRAAKILVPRMKSRRGGHFLFTASAAGLLTHVDSATYSVTKTACVAFAEWLSIAHGDQGIGVSVLCPQAVATAMLPNPEGDISAGDGVLTTEQAAIAALKGVRENRFLILPHPTVADYRARKTADIERWIRGMRRLRSRPI